MTNHITAADLDRLKFRKIAEYRKGTCIKLDGVKITERASLCYMMVIDGLVMYVGKSKQGYSRPLRYIENNVMKHVNEGVLNAEHVDVYVRCFEADHPFEEFILNLYSSYEEALIAHFLPPWNKDKPKQNKDAD